MIVTAYLLVAMIMWAIINSNALAYPIAMAKTRKRALPLALSRGFASQGTPFAYTGTVIAGVVSEVQKVPDSIDAPDYHIDGIPKLTNSAKQPWQVTPKSPGDIAKMRVACRIAREVLDTAIRFSGVGVTTDAIDKLVHRETIKRKAYPSPLNYYGFPKSCCTSVNEIICHGIPDSTILKSGDIMNIDITVYHDGVHGDCSETVLIGDVSDSVKDLVKTTYDAWDAAIAYCKPGRKYSGIGGVIEDVISKKGYTSVKEFCGHGIGRVFHENPNVLHYRNNERAGTMAPGHTFTIEPMVCLGSNEHIIWPDQWTAATSDGKPTAQFEHTLLITNTGVEKLTAKLSTSPKYPWEM